MILTTGMTVSLRLSRASDSDSGSVKFTVTGKPQLNLARNPGP